MTPYLARIRPWIASKSAPDVTSSAVPSTDGDPPLTRPRASAGWSVILGFARRRLHLPDADEVQKPTRDPSSAQIQVWVGTAAPDLRYVVEATNFSSLIGMRP